MSVIAHLETKTKSELLTRPIIAKNAATLVRFGGVPPESSNQSEPCSREHRQDNLPHDLTNGVSLCFSHWLV